MWIKAGQRWLLGKDAALFCLSLGNHLAVCGWLRCSATNPSKWPRPCAGGEPGSLQFPGGGCLQLGTARQPGINQRLISFYSVMVSGQWLGTVANPGSSEKRSKRLTNFRFALKMTWCAEQNMYDAVIRSFWCWILIATCGRNGSLLRKLWHIAEDLPQRPQLLALQLWWSRRPGVWVSSQWAKGHMLKTPCARHFGPKFCGTPGGVGDKL